MDQYITNLLAQIPIVVVFIYFVMWITKQERQERVAMAEAAALERKERDKAAELEREKRDAEWRMFLSEQREAGRASAVRLAEEIKSIGQTVAAVYSMMQIHDQRVTAAIPEMHKEITRQRRDKGVVSKGENS